MESSTAASPHVSNIITARDKSAVITVTAALALVCMLLFLFARLYIRYPWKSLFGLDDVVTSVASVVGLVQTVLVFSAVQQGLGEVEEDIPREKVIIARKLLYASDIVFIIVTCLAKLAVAFLLHRLAASARYSKAAKVIGLGVLIWGFVSVFVVAVRSENLSAPWIVGFNSGSNLLNRWIAVGGMSIVIELCLTMFPVFLVQNLQMSRSSKMAVVTGFALRLRLIALTICRLISLSQATTTSDQMFVLTIPTIYSQVELHFSVMSATIPSLRVFLKSLNTGYMGTTLHQIDPTTATIMATKGSGRSYNLSDLSRHRMDERSVRLRPQDGHTTTHATRQASGENASISSHGSEDIIIRKTVVIDYGT